MVAAITPLVSPASAGRSESELIQVVAQEEVASSSSNVVQANCQARLKFILIYGVFRTWLEFLNRSQA